MKTKDHHNFKFRQYLEFLKIKPLLANPTTKEILDNQKQKIKIFFPEVDTGFLTDNELYEYITQLNFLNNPITEEDFEITIDDVSYKIHNLNEITINQIAHIEEHLKMFLKNNSEQDQIFITHYLLGYVMALEFLDKDKNIIHYSKVTKSDIDSNKIKLMFNKELANKLADKFLNEIPLDGVIRLINGYKKKEQSLLKPIDLYTMTKQQMKMKIQILNQTKNLQHQMSTLGGWPHFISYVRKTYVNYQLSKILRHLS